MLDKAVIQAIAGPEGERIAAEFAEAEMIIKQRQSIEKDTVDRAKDHQRIQDDLKARWKDLQARCKHWTTSVSRGSYPSNDSSTTCNQCGKEL